MLQAVVVLYFTSVLLVSGEELSEKCAKENECAYKCEYMARGVIDESGKLVEKKLPPVEEQLAKECFQAINETEICKRMQEIDFCITSAVHLLACRNETKFEDVNDPCLWRCAFGKMGFLDEKFEMAKEIFEDLKPDIETVVSECGIKVDAADCKTSVDLVNCVLLKYA